MITTAAQTYTLTVTLRSDLHLGTPRTADTVRRTLGHVPGSVVRGAYAAAWLTERVGGRRPEVPRTGALREEFLDLFEGGVRFGPLYAAGGPGRLSVLRHKYQAGAGCTPAWDQAAPGPADATRDELSCRTCGQVLEPAKGEIPQPPTTRRGHVERDAEGLARDGALFSRQSLRRSSSPSSPGPPFSGRIVVSRPEQQAALAALRPHLGGRRSSHGLIRADWAPAAHPALPEDPEHFVMVLNSPGVFVDDEGYPTRRPPAAELARRLGVAEGQVRIVRSWTRWAEEGGWHAASGLPKHSELVAAAGSTYVVEAGGAGPAGLAELWRQGVGLRRHEGFGELQ